MNLLLYLVTLECHNKYPSFYKFYKSNKASAIMTTGRHPPPTVGVGKLKGACSAFTNSRQFMSTLLLILRKKVRNRLLLHWSPLWLNKYTYDNSPLSPAYSPVMTEFRREEGHSWKTECA